MPAGLRFQPLDLGKDLSGLVAELKGPEAMSRLIANTARTLIDEADTKNAAAAGRILAKKVHVDGRVNAPLESVKPDGVILAQWDALEAVVAYAMDILILNSPFGHNDPRPGHPGLYSKSHILFADGEKVEFTESGRLPEADVYTILNTVPYARKIERGLSKMAPDGVYMVTAAMVAQRFGRVAKVGFRYIAPTFGDISTWAQQKSARTMAKNIRGGNAAGHNEWLRRQPAIVISRYA